MKLKLYLLVGACILWSGNSLLHADDDYERHEKHHDKREKKSKALRSFPLLTNEAWKAECASCHTLYHPGLLPERSWKKMMGQLENHFGEDASVDDAAQKEITDFLSAHSSDKGESRRAEKFNRSIPLGEIPLRITETRYFEHKHREIDADVWKRKKIGSAANCGACHGENAEKGIFEEEFVKIPKGP